MNYCSHCAAPVTQRIPDGDTRARHCCDQCGTVHYRNPLIVAGCIAEADDGRILLCRREIEPRAGYWTLPAGFMENDESLQEAARRETLEEACAEVELLGLSSVISVPGANQVHMMFRARLVDGAFRAGAETLEAALYAEHAVPWNSLAFRTVEGALKRYFADRARGQFEVHEFALKPRL